MNGTNSTSTSDKLNSNNSLDKYNNISSISIQPEDPIDTEDEYTNYRKSLIFFHECAACHYAQGMLLFGVGFFTAIRMQFIWRELNWKQALRYSAVSLIASSMGMYKFSYAYHIFQAQGKIKHMKNKERN